MISNSDLKAAEKKLSEITKKTMEMKTAFLKQILFLAVTLFGILISFHSKIESNTMLRLSFALALVLLLLGILLLSISLYESIEGYNRLQKGYREMIQAQIEGASSRPVLIKPKKVFEVCEKSAYISLLLSLILFALYSVLRIFVLI